MKSNTCSRFVSGPHAVGSQRDQAAQGHLPLCTPGADGAEPLHFRGRPLCLRGLQAEDRARIEAMLTRVAQPDLATRFFTSFRRVPPALLDWLVRIDPTRRLVVVAVLGSTGTDGDSEIVAVARAHLVATGDSAEAALLVRSDFKGEGLGTLLLGRLIAQCRQRGISRLIAEVMTHNSRMLRLAKKYGFRCEAVERGSSHLTLELRVPAP